jgi:nitroreductase
LPWEQLFLNDDFSTPLTTTEAGAYTEALELLRLGPSASNRQPWRVLKTAGAWHFFLHHNPNYRKQMKLVTAIDLQRVDIGIAMSHFALTATALGLRGVWQTQPFPAPPDPDTEYIISWVEQT